MALPRNEFVFSMKTDPELIFTKQFGGAVVLVFHSSKFIPFNLCALANVSLDKALFHTS